jgi:hypothetical protein
VAWLSELARVLCPQGLALISVHSVASIDSASRERPEWTKEVLPKLEAEGFYFTGASSTGLVPAVVQAKIPVTSRYGFSVQTEDQIRRVWSDRFEILEFTELAFRRHQTLVVLRKRGTPDSRQSRIPV